MLLLKIALGSGPVTIGSTVCLYGMEGFHKGLAKAVSTQLRTPSQLHGQR